MGTPSDRASRLPDFIAVGPPRTGTTWLYRVLTGHVGLPFGIKETQFFVWNYDLGLEWYLSYLRNAPDNLPLGEIAPTYFDHPEARQRIAALIARCRIIISLRDPVDRIYSQYKTWCSAGLLDDEPFDYQKQRSQLGASTSYAINLKAWREAFGKDNVLVVLYDDLRANPQAYLDSVCSFIGIAPIDLRNSRWADDPVNPALRRSGSMRLARAVQNLRDYLVRRGYARLGGLLIDGTPLWNLLHAGGKEYPRLSPETEAELRNLLRPEVEELELLLGRDLSAWKLPQAGRSELRRAGAGK
jgi:Sulfotransferase domain